MIRADHQAQHLEPGVHQMLFLYGTGSRAGQYIGIAGPLIQRGKRERRRDRRRRRPWNR